MSGLDFFAWIVLIILVASIAAPSLTWMAHLICSTGKACMRAMRKLPVVPICRSLAALPLPPNQRQISPRPVLTKRGVSRSSRTLRRDAVDAKVLPTNSTSADGEVVWSWRPDAGVKLAGCRLQVTVAKEPGHRGEHEGNR
jgi:hypothetical protein